MMSLLDMPFIIASFIFLVISISFIYLVFQNIFSGMEATGMFTWLPDLKVFNIIFNGIPFIILGFGIGSILLAVLTPNHPIFLPFAILGAIFCLFLNLIMMNVMENFVSNFPFLSNFPILAWFLQRFGFIIFVLTVGIISVMYLVR